MAKMGRPTDNPKPYTIAARIDEKSKLILNAYCEQEQVNQMEAVRRAIGKLEGDLKTRNETLRQIEVENEKRNVSFEQTLKDLVSPLYHFLQENQRGKWKNGK